MYLLKQKECDNKKMKSALLIGATNSINGNYDGQTIKTIHFKHLLEYLGYSIAQLETTAWKKHPFSTLTRAIKLIRKSNTIFLAVDRNGIRLFPYLINLFKKKKSKVYYVVIGGFVVDLLNEKAKLAEQIKKFAGVLVETNTMKTRLNNLGLNNVFILDNFKEFKLNKGVLENYKVQNPPHITFFSRVRKEKGVLDLVQACESINEKSVRVCLDVYGKPYNNIEEELKPFLDRNPNWLHYYGPVQSDKSISILSRSFAMVLPTKFYEEGTPGVFIDCFFSGTPIISSNFQNAKDSLDNSCALIYSFNDVNELRNTITYALDHQDIINAMRKNCIEKAKKYTKQYASEKLLNILTSTGAVSK